MIKTGDIVEYKHPYPDEIGLTFTVIEVNGDRCIMSANVDMIIRPSYSAKIQDLRTVCHD